MKPQCKVTVLETKCFPELQERYLADPASGPCPCFAAGQEYLFEREDGKDDFWHFGRDLDPKFPCAEAWDCISRYIYTALQGGSHHAWLDRGRSHDDCLLQRRHASRGVQDRTNRHPRNGRRACLARRTGFLQQRGGCLHGGVGAHFDARFGWVPNPPCLGLLDLKICEAAYLIVSNINPDVRGA